MAIVHCRACKQKITRMDTTCPRCGAPNSRLMPLFLGIILFALCAVFYSTFKQASKDSSLELVVKPQPPSSSRTQMGAAKELMAGSDEAQ